MDKPLLEGSGSGHRNREAIPVDDLKSLFPVDQGEDETGAAHLLLLTIAGGYHFCIFQDITPTSVDITVSKDFQ